jgi:hypothetical protein
MSESKQSLSPGRVPGRGRGVGGRGNGTRKPIPKKSFGKINPSSNKFKGANEDLAGHIFDYGGQGHRDTFTKTMKAIINYVGQKYDNPRDIQDALESLKIPVIGLPIAPEGYDDGTATKTETLLFEKKLQRHILSEETLNDNLAKAFSLVIGQCTENLKAKLESLTQWQTLKTNKNVISLLEEVKIIVFKFEEQSYSMHSLFKANEAVYLIKQKEDETNNAYYKRFCNTVETAEGFGACFGVDEVSISMDPIYMKLSDAEKKKPDQKQLAQERVRQSYLAYMFIYKLDHTRYASLKKDFQNDYAKGNNNYPETAQDAYNLLSIYRYDRKPAGNNGTETRGLSFHQSNKGVKRTENNHKDLTCYACGKKGHIALNCPDKQEVQNNNNRKTENKEQVEEAKSKSVSYKDEQKEHESSKKGGKQGGFFQVSSKCSITKIENELQFMNTAQFEKLKQMLLLDNQSTTDLFCNKEYLEDIQKVEGRCTIVINRGEIQTDLMGHFQNYGDVWYHPDAITNILSLSNVKRKYIVTYDSSKENSFLVHTTIS